jgi:hypothetical protein
MTLQVCSLIAQGVGLLALSAWADPSSHVVVMTILVSFGIVSLLLNLVSIIQRESE